MTDKITLNKSKGFVKIYRSILVTEYWHNPLWLKAFLYLVLVAAYSDHIITIGGHRCDLKRGELITTKSELSREWGCTRTTVRRILKKFARNNDVTPIPNDWGLVWLRITKFADYQESTR